MNVQDDKEFLKEEAYGSEAGLNTRTTIQDRFGTREEAWFHWVFTHVQLPAGARVLDIGCGSGQMWWQNWQQLPQDAWLLLSDLSPAMVVAARESAPRYPEGPQVVYQIGEGEALPLLAGQFDAVMALGVLDHMAEPEKCLAEVQRVLRPGGRFYTSAGGRRHLQELSALVQPFLPDESYGGDPQRFGLQNGAEILRPWMASVSRFLYEDDLVFEEVGPIVDYVRSEGRVAEKLGRLKLAGFVEHLKARLAEEGQIRITREKGLFVGEL